MDDASAPGRSGAEGLHVVLGAGQVGPGLAALLAKEGRRVRLVRRRALAVPLEGVEVRGADLSDPDAATAACVGATTIYDCTNPASYAAWAEQLPPLRRGVRLAAERTGALLVSLDNLYMLGMPADGVLSERLPRAPCSAKGRLRAALEAELFEAADRGRLRFTIGRASDFFGVGAGDRALFGRGFVQRLAAGKAALVVGDPTLPRSYSYVPDVVRGLATLGAHPDLSVGQVFHLPVAWREGSTRELVGRFARALAVRPRTLRLPRWAFSLLGVVVPDLGAVREMLYQWEAPFVVDDSRFRATFGVEATPADDAIAASIRDAVGGEAAAPRSAA